MLYIKLLQEEELSILCRKYKLKIKLTPSNVDHFEGFRYFSAHSLGWNSYQQNRPQIQYVVAFYKTKTWEKIVGVTCLYPVDDFKNYSNVFSISYIDVHEKYRRKKIATKMYQFINDNFVSTDMVLFQTRLSDMGTMCQLDRIFKEQITKCTTFKNIDDFCEFIYSQKQI